MSLTNILEGGFWASGKEAYWDGRRLFWITMGILILPKSLVYTGIMSALVTA